MTKFAVKAMDPALRHFLAALSLAAALASAHASAPRPPDYIVTGDLIVKFRDTSESGKALAAVAEGARAMGTAASVAAGLSGEYGIPLTLVRVTSGREALLSVDRRALLAGLAQRARREPIVKAATPETPPRTVLPSELATVRVELKPSVATAAELAALANKLASGDLLRPKFLTDASGAALLGIDMAGLTLALIERLNARSDVEYAQANRVLRAIDNAPRN
ncbi:MAG: hypothetical protein KJ634_07045 [Gammaproteobacteria bacterium]|nr:hypothetical protein [Gammaproteobacteria bacterium]MBU1415363.1 hypothetical protein [Gammaproteobacteria bacterium]